MHNKTLKLASFGACLAVVAVCSACWYFAAFWSFPPIGESMLDPDLIGTWALVSTTLSGRTIVCPANDPESGFQCGANDTLALASDGTYEETNTSSEDVPGLWFAVNGRLLLEDGNAEGNPVAFTYTLTGDSLTIETQSGAVVVEYERQGAASATTQDILRANPALHLCNAADRNLIGSWQYVSIEDSGTIVTCPGSSASPVISCVNDQRLTFSCDNTFEETSPAADPNAPPTILSQGIWYTRAGRLLLDDQVFADHDPTAGTYTIENDVLTIRTSNGQHIVTATRPQE